MDVSKSDWMRGQSVSSHLGVAVRTPVMTTWESHLGICGPCKILYGGWYKNRQKSVSFSGNISDELSVVLVRAEPHKGYVTERVRSSAA